MSNSEPIFRSAKIASPKRQSLARAEQQHSECGSSLAVVAPLALLTIPPPVQQGWKAPKLTTMGLYYPVGRCNVSLPKDRLWDVMNSLVQLFHKLSLHVIYHDSPISATCYSMDQVELEVTIFADRSGAGLVLEIERIDGDSLSFHEYCQRILGAVSDSNKEQRESYTAPNRWCRSLRPRVGAVLEEKICSSGEIIEEAFEATRNMLFSDRYDSQRLGLESLGHMTDPNKSGVSVAISSSRCLLFPQTPLQQQLSHGILEYALGSDDFSDLALVILAQSFQQGVTGRGHMASVPDNFFGINASNNHHLVDCLMDKVNEMQSQPHKAYYAIVSLAAMCECIPSLRLYIKNRQELLQKAQLFGDSCHLALAVASRQLLQTVEA